MSELTDNGAEFMDELLSFYGDFTDDISSDLHPAEYCETWENELKREFGKNVGSVDFSRHYVLELPNETEEYGRLIEGEGDYVVKLRGAQNFDNSSVNQAVREPRVAAEAVLREDDDIFAEIIGVESDYDWIVMEEVEPTDLSWDEKVEMLDEYEDRGWNPKDPEFGETYDGRTVCYDYGLFDRSEWKVQAENILNIVPAY